MFFMFLSVFVSSVINLITFLGYLLGGRANFFFDRWLGVTKIELYFSFAVYRRVQFLCEEETFGYVQIAVIVYKQDQSSYQVHRLAVYSGMDVICFDLLKIYLQSIDERICIMSKLGILFQLIENLGQGLCYQIQLIYQLDCWGLIVTYPFRDASLCVVSFIYC
eukprot:TRINITY_DN5777_c1_g1_i3.p3 TRINITY_DN5777_c1_g1~~TRINITY_DN5777_c1_g1_i3.p3  ORF type:complete len:164 (-),score=6.89 TRINITY_DN5777_c1_g1_i3:102-593(-)